MMTDAKCKICRRSGVKLFLKGDRCFSAKCQIVRRPYPPGPQRKKKRRNFSEFGVELREKQRLKNLYQLRERQFEVYVEKALSQRGKVEDATILLVKGLESRLDNVVFRLGFASSRAHAKQLVSHGHFLVNKKTIDIPSFQVKKGHEVSLKEISTKKKIFENIKNVLKKQKVPSWLELNAEKLSGKVIGAPQFEETMTVEIPAIFEYYSR